MGKGQGCGVRGGGGEKGTGLVARRSQGGGVTDMCRLTNQGPLQNVMYMANTSNGVKPLWPLVTRVRCNGGSEGNGTSS